MFLHSAHLSAWLETESAGKPMKVPFGETGFGYAVLSVRRVKRKEGRKRYDVLLHKMQSMG